MALTELWVKGEYCFVETSQTVAEFKEQFDVADEKAGIWTTVGFSPFDDERLLLVRRRSWILFIPSDNDLIRALNQYKAEMRRENKVETHGTVGNDGEAVAITTTT